MKILHVINSLGGGGRERRMSQVVASLASQNTIKQVIITLAAENAYEAFSKSGATIHLVQGGRTERIKQFHHILIKEQPDIVHLWLETPTELFFFSYAKHKFRYKTIVGFVADANVIKGFSTRSLAIRFAFSQADVIISNSIAGLKAKHAPLQKSKVIYNGFDFNRFRVINRQQKRNELGVQFELLVVMCASMTVVKDWDSFIALAQTATSERLNAKFLGVGGGTLLEKYQNEIDNLGLVNIQLIGRRNDVEDILQAADIAVLFTNNERHAEGVSNSIMEAMAAGLPVIATEGGGTCEIIKHEKNGYVVNPKDVQQSLNIIKKLIAEPEIAVMIGKKAKETIQKDFLREDKMKEYMSLYQTLIN